MIVDNIQEFDVNSVFLRRMRNDIIGSEENKIDYIINGYLKR